MSEAPTNTGGGAHGVRLCCSCRGIDFDLTALPGRTLALVGPNGAGKSTALQVVAGLAVPGGGRVHVGGRAVAGEGVRFVPPHRRGVGMLTQRALLFDHLSVLDNVAFGPRAAGLGRRAARERALQELRDVGAEGWAQRRPRELSGGQQQRVALARALAADPEVLLLDEPLAALDVQTAQQMRALLADRLRRRTVLLVTHDALDLWTLADDLALVEGGRARVVGTTDAAAASPPSGFVAGLLGLNRLVGRSTGPDRMRAGGCEVVGVAGEPEPVPGAEAMALFEPAAVVLSRPDDGGDHGSARNCWPVTVTALEPRGALVRVRLVLPDGQHCAADVTARSAAGLGVRPGAELVAVVKAAQVTVTARV